MGEVTQDELRGSAGGSVGPEISAAIEERGIGNKSQVHDGPSVKETADVVGRPTNNVGNDGQDMCTDKNEEQYEQSGAKVCASRSAMV